MILKSAVAIIAISTLIDIIIFTAKLPSEIVWTIILLGGVSQYLLATNWRGK